MKWIGLGAIPVAIAALLLFHLYLAAGIVAALIAVAFMIYSRHRTRAPDPLYYCAECGRCLGSREQGIEMPCPECGGREYFNLEKKS